MCASSTSRRWFRRRQSRMPALVRPDLSVVTATSLAILRPVAAARMARWSRYLLARPTLNPHANRCISTDRTVSTREIHILLHAQYLASTPPRLVLSLQTIVRGEQCTRGALLAPTKAEGSGGVVADIAKLSVGREEYYTRELATDHEQYLSGQGESPGRWYGAGASGLGLEGEASVAGFQAMFEGRDPTTGELLGRPHGRNAVPAFDVVLRPTKSVSILYGLGDPATGRAVLQAHHAGLAEAVGYLDEHLGARRGHGGHEHVSGRGLLAVGFDHRTSREGDPLLHTHLVVANRVPGPDGRWTALDGRDLYRHRLATDAIYRATYQRELVRTLGWSGRPRIPTATGSSRACPRTSCGGSPSAPARSTPSSTG